MMEPTQRRDFTRAERCSFNKRVVAIEGSQVVPDDLELTRYARSGHAVFCPRLRNLCNMSGLHPSRFGPVTLHMMLNDVRGRERIMRGYVVQGSTDRIILFSWSTNPQPLKRNVARVDKDGNVVWRAELPTTRSGDCFISLMPDGDEFVAQTYGERLVRLNTDGETLHIGRMTQAA